MAKRQPTQPALPTVDRAAVSEDVLKTQALHANEKIVQQLEGGYLFHKGNGVVYYRSHEEVLSFHDENQFHQEEVVKLPPRNQSGLPR